MAKAVCISLKIHFLLASSTKDTCYWAELIPDQSTYPKLESLNYVRNVPRGAWSGDAIFHCNNLRTLLVEWNVHHSFHRRAGTREKCPVAHLNELHRHVPISDETRR